MTQKKWYPDRDPLASAVQVVVQHQMPVDDLLWAVAQTVKRLRAELSRDTDGESGSDIIQSLDTCMRLTIERLEQIRLCLQGDRMIDRDNHFWHNEDPHAAQDDE